MGLLSYKGTISGLKVNFLVHLQSFASKIFFHEQTDETTSKFFPFEMPVAIRTDISHSLLISWKV